MQSHWMLLVNFEMVIFVTKQHNDVVNCKLCRAETIQMENRVAELEKGSNIQVTWPVAKLFNILI